ncbi:CRISPR-associated protein Cas4 [Porphyromonas cangingivalis]|uniref:CRISPR-associated protein Cas4 n=1 Tax=Porphyromonas cangingivalis TaxID=36874 RepID=UPI000D855262|nr:CRISPR-associated protein Cas4 [Porphyromonas cangingivalis]SPY35371.1 CRISPR-associated protein Cas4 [Porphyromonas cangingivalis]
MYTEDELLMLSGLQHFKFCPRQWYLIHIEQIWQENELTTLGQILHERVHQPEQSQRRGTTVTLRSVPLASYQLGIYGFSDAIELHPATGTEEVVFTHPKYPGRWEAVPIEYKRGRPKRHNADRLQLCAEAICLEEAYGISIPLGYLFYGEAKHREEVVFSPELREELLATVEAMHEAFRRKSPIPAVYASRCRSCSLFDQCLPKANQFGSASAYLTKHKLFDL